MSKRFRPNPKKVKPQLECPNCGAPHNHKLNFTGNPIDGYFICNHCKCEYIRPHNPTHYEFNQVTGAIVKVEG
jgi:ssDNA-binding Zn-finger/Zn-ribbon topoisomerase 1